MAVSMTVMTALTGCVFDNSSGTTASAPPAPTPPPPTTPVPSNITNPSGSFAISVFATNPTGSSQPDDIVPVQTAANTPDSAVFIDYQDRSVVDPMGNLATGAPSGTVAQGQVIEYDLTGKILQTVNVPGHIDGMVQNTVNDYHTLWVMSDEDANPKLSVVNFSTKPATVTTYTADAASVSALTVTDSNNGSTNNFPLQHGGGLDDLKIIGSNVYVSASAPATTTTPANPSTTLPYSTSWTNGASCGTGACGNGSVYGINQPVAGTTNTNGAIQYQITLNIGASNTFHVAPVVSTNGSNTQTTMLSDGTSALTSNNTAILNATDADSTALDPNGDLWIDSQQDGELIHVSNMNPALTTQTTSVLPLTYGGTSWTVDDFRWVPTLPTGTTGKTFMLVTDTSSGYVYRVDASSAFTPGQVFAAAGNMITSINMTTGVLTPVFINFKATHGLNFINP